MSNYQAITARASFLCQKADAVRNAIQNSTLPAAEQASALLLAENYEQEAKAADKAHRKTLKKFK